MTPDINRLRTDLGIPVERPHVPVLHNAGLRESEDDTSPELDWGWLLALWLLGMIGAALFAYFVLWPLFLILLSIVVAVLKVVLCIIVAIFVLGAIFDS